MSALTSEQKSTLRKGFLSINDPLDILNLFNHVGSLLDSDFKNISLKYFNDCIYNDNTDKYRTFEIPKKTGNTRLILSPDHELKKILQILKEILHCFYFPQKNITGFVKGRSIVDNAKIHINSEFVYNIDIKNFFHSFTHKHVQKLFKKSPFLFNNEREYLAIFFANLTTISGYLEKSILPTGSPTSPILSNLLFIDIDKELNNLAKDHNARYSRYADDITFSSISNLSKNTHFLQHLSNLFHNNNFELNYKKERVQSKSIGQVVTGLKVNEKVNVNRKYIKELRMWLYYCEKYGYEKAENIFHKKNDCLNSQHKPSLNMFLKGKLNFLKMVKGQNDSTYQRLYLRYERLFQKKNKNKSFTKTDSFTQQLKTDLINVQSIKQEAKKSENTIKPTIEKFNREILVVDIETTGFLKDGGKIVEIGIVKLNLDNGVVIPAYNSLVKEPGFDRSHTQGKFGWIFKNSDLTYFEVDNAPGIESQRAIIQDLFDKYPATAFNKAFDFDFLRSRGFKINDLPCPMIVATPICKLPSKYNFGDYKWPKVEEAWEYFFGNTGYIEAHRGLDDAKHEALIVYKLYKLGVFEVSFEKLVCPICKQGEIIKNRNFFGCSRLKKGCYFKLDFEQYGKKLTNKQAEHLIMNGKTGKIAGFKINNKKVRGVLSFNKDFTISLTICEDTKKKFTATNKEG